MLLTRRSPTRISQRELFRLILRTLACFVLCAIVWVLATPLYNRVVAGASGLLFSIVESNDVTTVRTSDDGLVIYRQDPGRDPRPFMELSRYLYVGLVPMLALLLGTPHLGALRRLRVVALGVLMLFLFHVLYLVLSVELIYVVLGLSDVSATGAQFCAWAEVMLRVLDEVVAILIWALLAFRIWWRVARPGEITGAVGATC